MTHYIQIQIIIIGTPLSWIRNDGAIGLLKEQAGESEELIIIETHLESLVKFDFEINEIINEIDSVHFLSIANHMCGKEINIKGNNYCIGGFLVDGEIIPYSWDWYHHTLEGSTHIAEKIETQLDNIIENKQD